MNHRIHWIDGVFILLAFGALTLIPWAAWSDAQRTRQLNERCDALELRASRLEALLRLTRELIHAHEREHHAEPQGPAALPLDVRRQLQGGDK